MIKTDTDINSSLEIEINSGIKYKCILVDPPWPLTMAGQRKRAKEARKPTSLPYKTMSIDEIKLIPVENIADIGCHLWLWTTNQHIEDGFDIMRSWRFKYLMPIHWIKPSGMGNWFVHRTQTILFGYYKKCQFDKERYRPNIIITKDPKRHSQKPEESFELIESVSTGPCVELFARQKRNGWKSYGNELDIESQPAVDQFACLS